MAEVVRDQARSLTAPGATDEERKAAPGVLREAEALESLYAGKSVPASGTILGAPVAYWRDLKSYDSVGAARSLRMPVLVLQGERDYQVSMEDFRGWKKALWGRAGAALKSYPSLNHLFAAGEGRSTPDEYRKSGHVAAEVVEDIAAFVRKSPPAAAPSP